MSQQVSPPFTPICNLIPSSPVIDVDITIHMDTVQLFTKNVTTATTLVISLLYVESHIVPEAQ